ncbi:hypothetical protein [Agarivorans sp. 1_MG-2023]|uniref:hypothetical protein n=1 Tax=Agarivorans sp. 1_MG-2023 TaxID=3062634 RepID=UPI0026E25A27|nr:hypothetical protein [Agarivorans sp. 1_MG-2023]MDO6762047.1 hypothetical protein [Agarivorans sp. 1_MG-2023]
MTRLVTKDTLTDCKVKGITGYAKGPNIILIKHLALSLLILGLTACAGNLIQIKLKVVDQDGHPVKDAKVVMNFMLSQGSNDFDGLTDKQGEVSARRTSQFGAMIGIYKDGYYPSNIRRTSRGDQNLTIELRKKKNPTAMYAKKLTLRFPKKKTAIGFDFEQADWVTPYGMGNTAHILFYLEGEYVDYDNNNNELRVSFTNVGDGLIKLNKATTNSEYLFPYQAPDSPYSRTLALKKSLSSNTKTITTYDSSALGYIFRVNTKLNSEGEVIHANYGKILGEFFSSTKQNKTKGRENGFVRFTYYYNPAPNDRSLEFDWRQNLFHDLVHEEKVKAP